MDHNFIKKNTLWKKLHIDLTLLICIILLLLYGIFITWSATGKNIEMIQNKIFQIFFGLLIMFILAQIPPKFYAFWSFYIYSISIMLLILVNILGTISKGAQRWLELGGIIRFQPSEIIKISILLITAYYIHSRRSPISIINTIIILLITIIPVIFIAAQPDLGTAILTVFSGLFILFLSGVSWKLIISILLIILLLTPIFWCFFIHEYQKIRILSLFYPDMDPLGSGYHIIQSKIAIGSGGLIGKGWLNGTQSQLEFLPERHTDFIFAVIGEELGFLGILLLLLLYLILIFRGFFIAKNMPHTFGKLVIGSFMLILFINIFINIGMVSGLFPIVGVPLPFISYGGSSLLVLMIGFGIIMSLNGHKKNNL